MASELLVCKIGNPNLFTIDLQTERWFPVIQAFRAANVELAAAGRPHLTEDVLLMVQKLLKHEAVSWDQHSYALTFSDHVCLISRS